MSGVTANLAPKLADILDVKLRMQSRGGEFVIPPPAYFFSPFYVDQDTGWQRSWSSFASMQQFENYRQSLALFHAGVRPNEYYAAQADKIEADRAKAELWKERDALGRAATRLQAGRKVLAFLADRGRRRLPEFPAGIAPGSRAGRSGDWVEKQRFTSFDQDILAIEEILDETKGGQGDRCLTAVGLICAKTVFAITVSDNDFSATWAKAALMSRRTDRIPSSPASSAFARYFIHSARRRNFFLAS